MTKLTLLVLVISAYANAQVCCSPVGSGQAGGGALMNNWVAHWPNTLMGDDNWHWMSDMQITNRGPAGNIHYGPQVNTIFEVSRSISRRNVLFVNAYAALGALEEKVTYLNSETLSYSGGISGGIRIAIGNRGRTFTQVLLNLPGHIEYVNDDFPFNTEAGMSGGLLLLHNIPMPWAISNPDFLSALSIAWSYQKNSVIRENILSDHRSVLHLSSSIHSVYPIFLAPFIQIKSEQLLAPPTVWTSTREKRLLGVASMGIDLAISKPYWEKIKLRIAFPIIARSSSNGFPDGTQPAAYLSMAANTAGIIPIFGNK